MKKKVKNELSVSEKAAVIDEWFLAKKKRRAKRVNEFMGGVLWTFTGFCVISLLINFRQISYWRPELSFVIALSISILMAFWMSLHIKLFAKTE